jgi:peptidoglycan/LPS O-acetylase OafA/YrhL
MTNTIDAQSRPLRYVELDSLRGLAALMVVFQHLQLLWETDTHAARSSAILGFLLGLTRPFGSEAVILFFVLSGFVLSLPAVNGKPQSYPAFLIRRIFRIYIPYLAAIAASVAGAFWLHGVATTKSRWFSGCWSEPVSWRLVLQYVVFVGVFETQQFDSPIWSLVHEMRISLIFPLLCEFVLRLKSKWSFVIAGGLTISALVVEKRPFHVNPLMADSLHYAGIFVLGIFLARERNMLGIWFRSRNGLTKGLLGIWFLWLYRFAAPLLVAHIGVVLPNFLFFISQWLTALGAGGLIIISLNSVAWKHVLMWRPIHFLGQISYSLYLWHFVVLLYCIHLFYGKVPLWAILCLVSVLSVFVSWLSYRWIEIPSMNLGRRLSNAFPSPAGARRAAIPRP